MATSLSVRVQQPNQQQSASRKMSLEDTMLVTKTPDEETEDGRIRNREAATRIRDAWIYKQIRLRQDEFTQYRTVRALYSLRVATTRVTRKDLLS